MRAARRDQAVSPPPATEADDAPPPEDDPTPEVDSDPTPPAPQLDICLPVLSIASMPGSCWRPYGAGSPFNRTLPASPPLAGRSAEIVKRWARQPDSNMFKFAAGNADTPNDYDHPIYFSTAVDPLYTISCRRWTSSCAVQGLKVRIPARARPAGGSDAHMTVIDQATGWEYDFWETEPLPAAGGTLYIGHGGKTRIDGDGLGSNATAAHFGAAAGLIRPEELAEGQINHALFLVVDCTNGTSTWPAADGVGRVCSSIGKQNANAPAMGQHFYLAMSRNKIKDLDEPRWKKAILLAMRNYGLYVGDTGGGSLKVMSSTSYTSFGMPDPWVQLGRSLNVPTWMSSSDGKRKYAFDLSDAVQWTSKLRVIAPCFDRGSC